MFVILKFVFNFFTKNNLLKPSGEYKVNKRCMLRNRKYPLITYGETVIQIEEENLFNLETFGHTVIEMDTLEIENITNKFENMKKEIMVHAINKINKEESLLRSILNYNYYILSYYISFLCILFCKKFTITNILFTEPTSERMFLFDKKSYVFVYDKGIFLNKILIPYENIISLCNIDNYCCLEVFGKFESIENRLHFSLEDSIIKIALQLDNVTEFCNHIKSNMFYHIKYNKINDDVVGYYYKKQ